ncbi:protein phosphatase 2C [Gregarina niphandrodes]|uniref:protein-serine/threonine phosphatase n=1 Tax=Gregarina niphandrodes TaxID=110365 RepID=A0A023BAK6_GRENI|nr:protein phosphatase 2C [Gregarina niphandrodes]EZG78266.1 protein phosphatase 2C [Gregarina niphandrodes]|eukprot:XP_011129371.1 protein phosphatase 2C [Gregarina niphandrodes]
MGSDWVPAGERGLWKREGTPWLCSREGQLYFEAFLPGVTQPASRVLGMKDCVCQTDENEMEKNGSAAEKTSSLGVEAVFGTSTMQGVREQQEDRFAVLAESFLPSADVRSSAVLVADGHVGATTAEFVADRLPLELKRCIQKLLATAPTATPKKRALQIPPSDPSCRKLFKSEHVPNDADRRQAASAAAAGDQPVSDTPARTVPVGVCSCEYSGEYGCDGENCRPAGHPTSAVDPVRGVDRDGSEDHHTGDGDKAEGDKAEVAPGESENQNIGGASGEVLRDSLQADPVEDLSSKYLSPAADIFGKLRECVKDCYLKVDCEFLRLFRTSRAGATCATAVILGDVMAVANVGDTRVVLVKKEGHGKLVRLVHTIDSR